MGSRKKTSSGRSSSSSKLPDDPVYLADHCLGGKLIVDRMSVVGETVHRLVDILPEDAPDTAVIDEVARRGWVLLTRDKRIRRRPIERNAVLNSRIAVFLAPGGTGEVIADAIVKARHRVRQWLLKHDRPLISRIGADGRLTVVDDFHDEES